MSNRKLTETFPIAPLKIIALGDSTVMGQQVDEIIVDSRKAALEGYDFIPSYFDYDKESYLVDYSLPRFGSGEAKGMINETIRGCDVFIIADVMNYSNTYKMFGIETLKSPDDQLQDLKRIIAACKTSKAKRITVFMPFLYESRQNKRSTLESLDAAVALQELSRMGVDNIITFDAHDPTVQNAIPIRGFDNFYTSYQFIRELLFQEPELKINKEHLMVISPDEGGMSRAVYYANVLGVEMGMFYKRRDYSTTLEDGKHPIVSHEFLGSNVENKDVFIVDDMISSGGSILEVAKALKERKANRVFIAATFGLFCDGLEPFDKYYESGYIDRILTTNLIYTTKELLNRPYYTPVDLSRYIGLIIDTLNHDTSVNDIINADSLIADIIAMHNKS